MTDPELLLRHEDGVAIVTLNNPARLNAWTSAMRAALGRMLAQIGADDAVKAVVLTGAGERAFCSGQDFSESQNFDGGADADRWLAAVKSFYEIIRSIEKPTICALNGLAAGSGFQVALLLDYRVGHAGVTMGQPELNNGIPSVVGPWAIFAERIGVARSMELILTGRMIDAQEARQIGLLNEIVPPAQVLPRSIAFARELGGKPPVALRLTKRAYREATQPAFDRAFQIAEEAQRQAFASGEPQRCMEEFFRIRAARKSA
ncbi:enoyl-CoA hydratase [Bosea sp. Root483D1]|uniref:enoyl-CoA hydratase/isomerase family protein n=1 Tax=Bosea sp. Root483D1 TaxID=1736544 RepID=UPI00070A92B3|nr:enoyl-CoA hydratase/isomerase family protein [Bosea sp. Root483D1]KRE20444.1 enoyl-CoA hydratase [Bosea sp. Root483D1]